MMLKLTPDLMRKFRESQPQEGGMDIDSWICLQFQRLQNIQYQLKHAQSQVTRVEMEYAKKLAAAKKEVEQVRSECTHEVETYNPDPAGGRDSFYRCDICGRER